MIHAFRTRKRIRSLPTATVKVNASWMAWTTMSIRMKAAA